MVSPADCTGLSVRLRRRLDRRKTDDLCFVLEIEVAGHEDNHARRMCGLDLKGASEYSVIWNLRVQPVGGAS